MYIVSVYIVFVYIICAHRLYMVLFSIKLLWGQKGAYLLCKRDVFVLLMLTAETQKRIVFSLRFCVSAFNVIAVVS